MKKYSKKILIFLLLLTIGLVYTYFIRALTDDELFNYGYAINILNNRIPYKDFNMIVPPLFHYILAFFLYFLGKKLIVYHLFINLLITSIVFLTYRKIGYKSILIYVALLFYPYNGYNTFSVFLLFLLLHIKERNQEKYSILEPIIIILLAFTKQTLALLIIPSLIGTQKKKKFLLIYLVGFLLFLSYLLYFNNLFEFIDYCILGMFDFSKKNNTIKNLLFPVELLIIGYLLYQYFKSKNISILYILSFQIIVFPIVDYFHFVVGFCPVIYQIFLSKKKRTFSDFYLFLFILSQLFTIHFVLLSNIDYSSFSHYAKNNFMKNRLVSNATYQYLKIAKNEIKNAKANEKIFILGLSSYVAKLNLNLPINEFDNINNGNLGYQGEKKYLKRIENICKENKCIFMINDSELTRDIQVNKNILRDIQTNYKKTYSSNIISIYKN